MIDLSKISGLPIELTDDYHLKFNEPLKQVAPTVRKFQDMLPVWADKNAKPVPATEDMYYMYRDIHLPDDEALIRKYNLRYDLTVVPPIMIGQEFNKTVGHYHPLVPGKNLAYPELYEVLMGEALFLIQKVDDTGKEVLDIQAIKAKVGDKVIYPPNYGHIIINIGKGPLITSNWSADNFKSIYEPIRDMGGMGYYVVADPEEKFKFVSNLNYEFKPWVKSSSTAQSGWGLNKADPMYLMGIKSPESLNFLNNPEILSPK